MMRCGCLENDKVTMKMRLLVDEVFFSISYDKYKKIILKNDNARFSKIGSFDLHVRHIIN